MLEEAPPAAPGDAASRPWQLLVLSARSTAALDGATARLARFLETGGPDTDPPAVSAHGADIAETATVANLADIAWSLQSGRKAFEHRRIVVARDRESARVALAAAGTPGGGAGPGTEAAGAPAAFTAAGRREGAGTRPVVFLLPGLGDQYVDMTRELYETEPLFRAEVDRCAEGLAPWLGEDLRRVMYSAGPWAEPGGAGQSAAAGGGKPDLRALLRRGGAAAAPADPAEERLRRTCFAQPACFTAAYALGRLLMSWGIEPQALIGYSVGEVAAACLAGSLDLDQALQLVARRARLVDELPGGAMLAVPLPEAEVRPWLVPELALAATNGPYLSVVAGPEAEVERLEQRLAGERVSCVRLRTTHAFHSPMMAPAAAGLAAIAAAAAPAGMRAPRIPWISNVTGAWITAADLADRGYWPRHLQSTVRFAEGLAELLREPDRAFVEVGPGATLATLVKQHPAAAANRVAVPAMRRAGEPGSDLEAALRAAGRLWLAGVEIDWQRLHGGERRRRVPLPSYPFERQRYWIDPPAAGEEVPRVVTGGASGATAMQAVGAPVTSAASAVPASPDLGDWFWVPSWRRVPLPPGRATPPGTAAAGMAAEAARNVAAPETMAGGGSAPMARWLVLADCGGLGARLAGRLRAAGHSVATAAPGSSGAGAVAGGGGVAGAGGAVGTGGAESAGGPGLVRLGEGAWSLDPRQPAGYSVLLDRLRAEAGGLPDRVLHLWGLSAGEAPFAGALDGGLVSLMLLAQALGAAGAGGGLSLGGGPVAGMGADTAGPTVLAVVANGLCEVLDGDSVVPARAAVLGALKVVRQELPRLRTLAVDAPPPPAGSLAEERLIEQLLSEVEAEMAAASALAAAPAVAWTAGPAPAASPAAAVAAAAAAAAPKAEPVVALRGSQRFVRSFEPVRLPPAAGDGLAGGGAFLIAGAEHGPGPALARQLLQDPRARVALVVSPAPVGPGAAGEPAGAAVSGASVPGASAAASAFGAANPAGAAAAAAAAEATHRLLAWARQAGSDRVLVLRCDCEDAAAMGRVVAEAQAHFGTLRGAFWTGGAASAGLLQLKSAEAVTATLSKAVRGAEVLLEAVDSPDQPDLEAAVRQAGDRAAPPPFVALFSTTAAVTGGFGLLDVAAAGVYLEALAVRRAAGAVDGRQRPAAIAVHWDPYQWDGWLVAGVAGAAPGLAPPEEVQAGLAANAVAAERSAAALERLLGNPMPVVVVAARNLPGLIAETDSVTADSMLAQMAAAPHAAAARPADLSTPYEPPRDELEESIAAVWQELFGIVPIGRDDSFLDLGGHSLLAIQIVTQLRQRLEADLPITALFEAPTVAQLAQAVRRARGEADPAEMEELLALVEGLSPEEAAERLAEMGA